MGTPKWEFDRYVRQIVQDEWTQMLDPNGHALPGIEGKRGVAGPLKKDIGCDFIKMEPGSKFPLHTHAGDHEIYFISGRGVVAVGGINVVVNAGDVVHIPADFPHGIWVPKIEKEPVVFIAFGYPHREILSLDRMTVVGETDSA